MRDWLQAWGRQAAQECKTLFWKNTSPYASAGPWRNSYQPWATTRKTARQMPFPWRADDFHRQHAATYSSNSHESSPPGRAVQQGCDFAQASAKAIPKPATVSSAGNRPALLETGCGNSRPYALSHGSRTGETRFCGLGRFLPSGTGLEENHI